MRIDILCFFQNIGDAFVGGSQRLGFGQLAEHTNSVQARAHLAELLRAQRQHRIDFFRTDTLLTQAASKAIKDKCGQGLLGSQRIWRQLVCQHLESQGQKV